MTMQETYLPALEMIDNTITAAPVVDTNLQAQVISGLRLSQAGSSNREELAQHVLTQAYQSVGFGPVLSVLKQYAS